MITLHFALEELGDKQYFSDTVSKQYFILQ